MTHTVQSPDRPRLKIKNSPLKFPVSRVFGIGRNYSANRDAEEKDENKTVLFMKDAYLLTAAEDGIFYPLDSKQLRYEIELVVAIGKEGWDVSVEDAEDYIFGYGVGVDFTKYDLQEVAKKHGWPWDRGKSFAGCAPCSEITSKRNVTLKNNRIWLKQNGAEMQHGTLDQMIWSVPEVISLVSKSFGLLPGDLIFTGTPQGIGMTQKGDVLEGGVDGVDAIKFQIK